MYQIFTANKDGKSGIMATFSFDSRVDVNRGLYVTLKRQTSWNEQTKRGVYKGGEECIIKLSEDEAAEMIKAIEKDTDVKFSHFTDDFVTIINFGKHPSQPDKAFYLNVSKTNRKDSNKAKFGLGISKGDYAGQYSRVGQLHSLKLFLEFALSHIWNGAYSEYLKDRKKYGKSDG